MSRLLAALALVCTLTAWWLDLTSWQRDQAGVLVAVGADEGSRLLRVLRTVACAAAAWVAAGDPADRRRLGVALTVCAAADVLLVGVKAFVPGVAAFAVAQVLLLRRAAEGVDPTGPTARRVAATAGAAWVLLMGAMGLALARQGLVLPVGAYGVVMLGSVGVAFTAWRDGARPGAQGARLAAGMALFAVTDALVGVGAAWPDDPTARLLRLHTGWSYTPALLLLVASVRPAR